jgi:PleD family two-component response regulator
MYPVMTIATQYKKHYRYRLLDKNTYFYQLYNENSDHHYYYRSQSYPSPIDYHRYNRESNIIDVKESESKALSSYPKRILIVDDDPDITLAFKVGLEDYGSFDIYAHTDPLEALSAFKPNFYDLLLLDINVPKMNGFELCKRILEIDVNVRICFITAADTNIGALREIYPTLSIGCFIKKPVTIEYLVKRLLAELD